MNIIEKVKDILTNFPRIGDVVGDIHIDFTDTEPTSYGLSSVGDELVKEDLLGNQVRKHGFLLYSTFSSINDYERLDNSTALLELSAWLGQQKGQPVETIIGGQTYTGKITKLTAANGMLYSIPQENVLDGVQYQLQIAAEYTVIIEEE